MKASPTCKYRHKLLDHGDSPHFRYQAQTTESIRSSILDYPIEHGRRYHAFKPGTYHRPNDEARLCAHGPAREAS